MAMARFFRRLRFRQAAIAVAFVCAAGALSACGGGGGGGGDTPAPPGAPIGSGGGGGVTLTPPGAPIGSGGGGGVTLTPPGAPIGGGGGGDTPKPPEPSPALPFITPAIVGSDGLPVQGLHYVRVGDRDMVQSEATDENGLFNPRFAPGRAADEVLFGVGSFSITTAANGNLDYKNPVFANENGFLVVPYRPGGDWSGLRIDIGRDGDDGGKFDIPKDSRKRYLASIFPSPPAPATATAWVLNPYVSPRLHYDGKPVAGLHYIRVGSGEECQPSTPTAADGSFDALILDTNPSRVTVTSAASIVFAVGPITVPADIADECVDRRQFVTDGFALATITVDASSVRIWHKETVAITTQNDEWVLQNPGGNAPTIADAATDADKRLLAGLNENDAGGFSVSVFVRPRFRYDGGDVENLHYLRWNDNGVLSSSSVDPMSVSRPTEANGAFDVLVTANLRARKTPVGTTPVVRRAGQIFEIESVLFALGTVIAEYDNRGDATVAFDLPGGGASLGILPLPGDSWRGKIVSVTHLARDRQLRMQTEADAVDISEERAIKRFLKAVVDNPTALAVEAKSVTLFSEPRVTRTGDEIAGLDYIRTDPPRTGLDYQGMTESEQTGDNGAFDPLLLAVDPGDGSRLTVFEAAKILFASGEIISVSGEYEFQSAADGGFQVGEASIPDGGWNAQTVPIYPSSMTLLPPRADTSPLPIKERVSRFVASLRGEPRLRQEVARGLNNPSALAVANGRMYLADLGASRIVSYAVGGNGRLSDSRDEIVGLANPSALAVANERLYLVESGESRITSYAIGEGGYLTPDASDEIVLSRPGFLGVSTTPALLVDLVASNKRIYVTGADFPFDDTDYFVKSYAVDTGGAFSSASTLTINFASQALAISDERLFVAADRQIVSYATVAGGVLSDNPQIIPITDNPSALLVAGGRLYVVDDVADKIVSYAIDASGRLSDLRDESVENLDDPTAIESTGGRIYIADKGVVDKIVSYEIGSGGADGGARRFEPFVYPRFLHGDEDRAQPVQSVSFIRVDDEGNPVMTVSTETDENGFFDPLQDGIYDENGIQIDQVVFGLGAIRASLDAVGEYEYQFDEGAPTYGFQIGMASKPPAGWSGKDFRVGREGYQFTAWGGTTINQADIDRFNVVSDGNGRKVASITPVGVPNLPFEVLPHLAYSGGDKNVFVGGAHYLRVGDSQMTESTPTNPNGSFDPIGKSGDPAVGIVGTVLFATEAIAVDSEGKYVVQAGTFIGAAMLSTTEYDGDGRNEDNAILWREKSYVFVGGSGEELTGDLPGYLFADGQTPPRIDYLAFEFFVEAEDKYPRFYHDGDYDSESLPLAGAHYFHSGLTASRVTDEKGIFNPIHEGKEVGAVYFATESITVDVHGITNFVDGSFIGAYTTALSFDGDLASSGFRERIFEYGTLQASDDVASPRIDLLAVDLFVGNLDRLPALQATIGSDLSSLYYLRVGDPQMSVSSLLTTGLFDPLFARTRTQAGTVLFALSPISVDIDDPDGYATPVNGFLGGVIAADLASPGWWRDKRFDILNGGLTAISSLDDSDVPDPLYLEAALAGAIDAAAGPARYDQILADRGFAAGFPQILYGASSPDKIYGEGLHYIRVGDREMSASRPVVLTPRDGQYFSHFNPITRAGEQASTVLFAFKRIVRDASASGGYRFVDGEEFDRGFQLGIATVAGAANGEWRSRLLTLAYRGGDDIPLEGVLPDAEFVDNSLCRIFVSGRRFDRAYGDEIGDSSANAARWRFAVDEKDGRGKVDGVYYWRIGDEYAPDIDITRAGGLFNPYRFDPVKGKCVASEIGFALGEPSLPPSLPHPRGADGGFYLGRAAFDVGKEPADDDRRIEYTSDFKNLNIGGGNVLVSDDNSAFRVFLAARGDDLFTVVFPAPRFLLADAPLAGVYAYNGAGEFVPLGQSGGGVGSFHPTTISADNEAIVVFYDKSTVAIATLVAKIEAGGEFNIDDLIGADNTNLRLALLGTLSRLRDNNLSLGLFPRFIDAPVLDLDYVPIEFNATTSMVVVTVSRRTGTVGVVGSFNPGVDVDEVFFAVGTISLADLGSVSDNPPPPYPPEHGALFNLFPHSGGFTAHFPDKRQTGVSVNGAWLGILRRPSHGWGGQVFSPYDFDIFGGETRRNERVWAIARFLQAADPDFPRPGATDNLPPEDQEIFLHNEAIAWASESGREVGFSAGDNGKLTLNTTLNVDAGDILVLKDEALETEVPASEASVGIKILDTLTLQFDSLAAAAGHLQAGISAFSQPPAAFADAPPTRDDSVLDFLPALSVFIHPFAVRTPLGLPYYFNRYSFSQGVNGKESRVPTVEGVSFDERTGEFVIDDYPGDRARGLAATMFIGYLHGEETRYRVMELQGARDFGVAASAEAITLTIDGAVLITFAHPNYLVSIADAFEQNYSSFAPPPERETIEASSFTWLFQALNFNTLYIEPIPRNNCLGEFIDRDDFFVFPSAGGEILVRYADAGDNCRRNADLPPPATSLRATVAFAAGDFQIEWDAVAGAIYYKLYRSADGGSPDRVGGDIADLEFVDRGLAVGIRYAYQVRACNNAGCSPLSPAVEVESLATPVLSAQVISKNGDGVAIALLWSEESATRFEIERALTLTGTYQSIADGEFAFSFRFVDSDVEAGTTYYYRLRLCNDFACSVYSEIVSITADAPSPNVSPTFTGTEEGKSQITLSWQEVPGAVSYRVLRSLPGEQFEVVADNLQALEYTDTGLLADQDYEYRVESCDENGVCAPVGNDLVVVRRPQPAPPEVVSSRIIIDGSATASLRWDAIAGATSYRLLYANSENGDYDMTLDVDFLSASDAFPAEARPDGIVRYYRLEVCSVFGCGRSAATKLSLAPLPAPIVASSPFTIDLVIDSATPIGANATLTLGWNQIGDAATYNVLRSTDGADGPYVALVTTTRNGDLMYIDDDLTVGAVYHYRLQACNVFGCGLSDPVELTAIDMIRIDSPSNVAVPANAEEGDKLFTVSFRGEEESASFDPAANDDFRTGGGEQAVVLLARAATAVFDSDEAARYFVLRARDGDERATVTVRLVSEPRAISPAPREVVLVTTEALRGSVALHRRDSGLSIWHNGDSTLTYSLQGDTDALFGVNAVYGLVTVNAPSLTVGIYDITLLLADEAISLTATLELRVRVIPDPEVVALQVFLDEIASGARQWRGGVSDDWDGDGIANPYDWTPTKVAIPGVDEMITVNLTLGGADGSAGSPWPIYNVWQLQAIASVSVAINGTVSDGLALFGGGDNAAAHYRLATDIDATPTRNWGDGFTPIGSVFTGSFDGEGREIRGLYMNRDGNAAMFLNIGANTDATGLVSRLGLPDVEIRGIGDNRVAALAAINSGVVSQVWATGEIAATVGRASGLVREMSGGLIQESWFVGRVISGSGAGGLVGYGEEGEIQDSWVVAQVEWSGIGGGAIGGLVGDSVGTFTLNQSWSGGGLAATLIGGEVTVVGNNYFDRSISRASVSVHGDVLTVDTMVTVSDADAGWDSTTWNFGDTADYPFLQRIEDLRPGLQAVAFADYQTDLILSGAALPADGETIPLTVGMSLALILDTNGLATAHAPTPICSADTDGVITAQTNYNNVTVQLQKIGDDEGEMSLTADCGINIGYKDDASSYRRFAVSMVISSQESTVSRVYPFKLASPFSPLPADISVPANATTGYEFLTLTMHAGELIHDGSDRVSVKGVANPPVVLTLVQPFTTAILTSAYTTTITTSVPARDSAVSLAQTGSILVFSLLKGGATALFANDDEIFVLSSLRVIIEGRTETTDTAANLRSLPRVRVATPSPLDITLTQTRVGSTVLAPGAAGIAIWHNFGAPETISITQSGAYFGVDEATGLVTIATQLSVDTTYGLTMELTDGTFTATREFRFVVGLAEKGELVILNISRSAGSDATTVTLGWRPVVGADSYTLSRADGDEAGTYLTIYEGAGEAVDECTVSGFAPGVGGCNPLADWLVFTESSVTLGSVYYYQLDSCGDLGCATSDTLSLSVSAPSQIFDNPPDASPAIEIVTLRYGPESPEAFLAWDVLLTVREGVNSDGDRYTLTTALPYEYRLSRSSESADSGYIEVRNESPFQNTRKLGYGDADLMLGSVYYYLLSVCNDAGCADTPSSVTLTVAGIGFGAPELGARVFRDGPSDSLTVTLTWSPIEGATEYRVLRASPADENDESVIYTQIHKGAVMDLVLTTSSSTMTVLTHTDTVLRSGIYYYQVEACDAGGCAGDRSNAVRVGPPLLPPGLPGLPAFEGVSNLAITDVDTVETAIVTLADAVLEWSAVEGANNYRLLRATIVSGIVGEYEAIYEVSELSFADTGLSYTDSDLPLGEIYAYRVWACDGDLCGDLSEAVTLRLQRPGRARILFDQSGSAREVKSINGAAIALSSITLAWEETPNAQYYYVVRGGEFASTIRHTISDPRDGKPLPMSSTTYRDNLQGDDVRHYWVQACNVFGCAELSDPVALGGGLLGIGEEDNPRAAGVSVALTLISTLNADGTVALTLTDLVETPSKISPFACRADVVTEVVNGETITSGGGPRINFAWEGRDGSEGGRFYRFARSRFAESTSADWVNVTAPATLHPDTGDPLNTGDPLTSDPTNFAATTFIDHSPFTESEILRNFAATTLYYSVQECVAVRGDATEVVELKFHPDKTINPHEAPICSAPLVVAVVPNPSLPQCAAGGVIETPLPKVNIRPELSGTELIPTHRESIVIVDEDGNKITVTYEGSQYVFADVSFAVRWDSVAGAAYYRVTRSTRDSGGEARFDSLAVAFVDGKEVIEHFDRVPLTRGLVNVYWVQACDNVNGCGTLSDPLELVAPSTDLAKSVVPVPLVVLVSVDSNLVTSGFVASVDVVAPPFADRYILSRALNPASGETAVYVNLREEDVAVFNHVDRELETGEQYLYRTQACNAAICITSDPNLVSVGLPNSLPGAPPVAQTPTPEATESVVDNKPQVDLRWAIVANVDAYTLTRSTKPDGSEAATIQISRERTYTDRNVEFDTGYYYQLQACNASGCADKSDLLSVTVSTPLPPAGTTPTLTARGEVANDLPQVSLGWDAVAEADRYIVTRSVNEDGEYGVIYTGGNLSHIDRGVKFDSPYYYRVQACNYFGCADVSEAASALVPTPADQLALAEFIKQIAADDFDWFGDRGTASSIDWDNDGITNPYDWTPVSVTVREGTVNEELVEVNLTLGIRGAAGTNFDPWPIYNVWQLQAIDGVSVSQTGEASVNFELFGDEESRLNARYRLAMDIDATPTRQWDSEAGFNPIGGSFGGHFDGRGNVVRGLFIDRADEEDVGLFADITNAGFLAVRDLGVEEADIRGERNVGIIAGSVIDADLLRVWSTGKVYGSDYYVGGVAGFFYANESDGKAGVRASWSAADVEGKAFVGGLVGQSFEVALQNAFSNNWSAGAVRGGKSAAGLVGGSTRTKYVASWTAGAVSGDSELAAFAGRGSANEYENAYWNANTSGVADSGAVGVVVQTLAADQLVSSLSDFGRSITINAWDVGDSELGVDDNSADFPLLRAFSRPLQAVYLARALTRILPTGSTATVAAESGTTFRAGGIRLDTNGLADNDGADGTSTPTCSFADGVLRAAANYNGITVEMSMLTDANATLAAITADDTENCEVGIQNRFNPTEPFAAFDATLRLEISAPATLSFDARRLTVEQAVRIESLAAERALLEFVEQIGADDFNWFANTIDWDGDGITNPYDWTPTVGVNLLLDGADGSAQYPWPIYNVWQLQAIDGMSVSQDGEATRGLSFFGGDRLGEQYRLAVNIDATPTEQWDGGAGFDPIGGDFAGYLDGGGYAVRGLFINRAIPEVGLFGRIVKSGELAVSDLGLENANISGGNQTGILVGNLNANLAKVWTTGEVTGTVIGAGDDEESGVGGLAGVFATRQNAQGVTDSVILSWSAAQVSGDNKVGGLIGGNLLAHRSQLIDNWAGGNVSGGVTVGGFVGNPANAEFIRSWSAGEVSGSVTGGFAAGPGGNAVYSSVYWNDSSGQADSAGGVSVAVQTLVAANFGGDDASAAWNFGDIDISDNAADFPFLKVHSQPWQAVNLADALTRILGVRSASTIAMAAGVNLTADIIRIDTNRMAADERTDGTSSPDCSFDEATGVLRATTNYNGVTVEMRLLGTTESRMLTTVSVSAVPDLDQCEIGVVGGAAEALSMRLCGWKLSRRRWAAMRRAV